MLKHSPFPPHVDHRLPSFLLINSEQGGRWSRKWNDHQDHHVRTQQPRKGNPLSKIPPRGHNMTMEIVFESWLE